MVQLVYFISNVVSPGMMEIIVLFNTENMMFNGDMIG